MQSLRLLLLSSLVACTPSTAQSELDDARAKWDREDPGAYQFKFSRSCECDPEVFREKLVTVSGDMITGAMYTDDNTAVPTTAYSAIMTVRGSFDRIQDAIDEDAYSIHVTYDPTLGYPSRVSIDYSLDIADEEFSAHTDELYRLTR